MDYDQEDKRKYRVVKSVRGYISIWLSNKEIPKGWSAEGYEGLKEECLKYIKEKYPENPDMKIYKEYFKMP